MKQTLLISSLLLVMFSIPLNASEIEVFNDWHVKCDDHDNCSASISLTSDRTVGADYTLFVTRQSHGEFWEISLKAYDNKPQTNANIEFNTDKDRIIFSGAKEFAAYNELNQYYFLGEKAQFMLNAMIPASKAKIIFENISGEKKILNFSLSGLSASLLYIEDKQDIVGTKRLVGGAPQNAVLVTAKEPHKIDDKLLELQVKANGCEPLDELVHGEDLMSYRLDATSSLHLIPCWAGAYNFGYTAYKQDEYGAEQLLFASYGDRIGWTGTKYLVNPYFDERYNRITDFYKGRGIGDCGSIGLWQWDKYYFALIKYEYKAKCSTDFDNKEPIIGEFPVIYLNNNFIALE